MSWNSDRDKLLRRAEKNGAEISIGNHIKVSKIGCQPVFVSRTTSDFFALKKIKRDLEREGYFGS